MIDKKEENGEDYITVPVNNAPKGHGRRAKENPKKAKKISRVGKNTKKTKETKPNNGKKKKVLKIILVVFLILIILLGVVFGTYMVKAKGSVKDAVLNMATDIVGDQDPIFVLLLGVSADISVELTDTIMLCGYNPSTQKAFMLSVPRDTFVGRNPASANGYDKINAKYQQSAEKTVEYVELLTGVKIDYYVIVRNISIESIFDCIGSIDFDVPINMDYDDKTQDLHIHLKKGYQTLEPDQIEQLLRFRHNNDGSSYPSSYGDNDYGRMRTQREFIKAAVDQMTSIKNIGKLKDLASMVYTNLQTNMSGYKVLDYVPHALKFSTSNLRSEQLPGESAMINELWFYKASKSKTRKLMDELMIYLELDDETLDSHYDYASSIKGVKPDENWVSNEVVIDDTEDYIFTPKKNTNTSKDTNTTQGECEHQYAVLDETKATCENKGTVEYKCINCGKEYSKQVDALGHDFVSGKCSRCGKNEKTSNSPSSSNTVKNETPQNDEADKPQQHTHSYTEVVTTKPATCTSEGSTTKKCSSCDATTQETIKALGHKFSGGPTCDRCEEKNPDYKPSSEPSTESTENKLETEETKEN